MNRHIDIWQNLYNTVRREMLACMETGNVGRARTVLAEYKAAVKDSADPKAVDMSEDLRADIVAAYGVGL